MQQDIQLKNITFSYQNQTIFNKLNVAFPQGQASMLMGKTGSGKSTLLKLIAGLYPKYRGQLTTGEVSQPLTCGMMFQNPSQQFTMTTARQEIVFSLENLGLNKKEYQQRLQQAVAFTQIAPFLDRPLMELSGGEKQKAALAVLIAMQVDLLLLDEPFANVDPQARTFLIDKLCALRAQGKTIIISDHDLSGYQQLIDRLFQLTNGQVQELDRRRLQISTTLPHYHFQLPQAATPSCFHLRHLTLKRQNKLLLKQADLKLYSGKITLLTGANGTGKSSFFKALSKMLPYQGQIFYQNKELGKYRSRQYLRQVGQVFQTASDQFLTITVNDEIALALKHSSWSAEQAQKALKQLELDQHQEQVVYSLSGGQQRKLQLLLMLMAGQEVLLVDEPLSGLDHDSRRTVLDLLSHCHKTLIIISHQLAGLAEICDYHLQLDQQQLTYVEA